MDKLFIIDSLGAGLGPPGLAGSAGGRSWSVVSIGLLRHSRSSELRAAFLIFPMLMIYPSAGYRFTLFSLPS